MSKVEPLATFCVCECCVYVHHHQLAACGSLPRERDVNRMTPGWPPAPLPAFSNNQAVAHHAYQRNATTTMAAHSRPDNAMIINVRPMQAKRGTKALPW